MTNTKRLRNNTIALAIIQILNYLLPFLVLPYVSRIFTVDKFGVIFFAQVLIDYFWRFVMFGFDLSGVQTIAKNRNDFNVINQNFNSIVSTQFLLYCFAYLILTLMTLFIPKFQFDWLIYHLTFLGLLGQILLFTWFYQGMERMKFITILNIITRSCFLIFVFIFIKKADDYILYPLFNSISFLIAGAISIFFIKKQFNINFKLPKVVEIFKTLQYSSQFFLTKVAIALYRSTNAFVLGLTVTSSAVAYYVAADKIFWGIFALYLTFVNALFPYMTKNKDIVFFKKMLKYLVLLSILASVFLFITSKYLILIFYSDKYIEAIKILQIFSLSFVFYIFVDTLGFPLLGAFGYVKETNQCYILGGIFNILGILSFYYLNLINIYSIAILVSITYLVMFLHRIYYVKKYKLLNIKENTWNSKI